MALGTQEGQWAPHFALRALAWNAVDLNRL